jgi:hypothetical protein
MALCNIIGDLGYVGFAFATQGFVSLPKLGGSLFTMLAHTILLAYGDDQAKHIAQEHGFFSSIVLTLRTAAQKLVSTLPTRVQQALKVKPVGIPFIMLSMNGVGLLTDALLNRTSFVLAEQAVLGGCVIAGCSAFAVADFVKNQKIADILLKIAPSILLGSTIAGIFLTLTTRNIFLMASVGAFLTANFAGFYTKIDKDRPVAAEI